MLSLKEKRMLDGLKPDYMRQSWLARLLINIAILLACAGIAYFQHLREESWQRQMVDNVKWAYTQGYTDGLAKKVDYKQLALTDRTYSNKFCTAWWFDATAKERWK